MHWFPSHWKSFPHGRSGRLWGIGVQVVFMAAGAAVVLARATVLSVAANATQGG